MYLNPGYSGSPTPSKHGSRASEERPAARHWRIPGGRRPQRLHLAIDSSVAAADQVTDLIVTDISPEGPSAMASGALTAGMRIMVDVPMIGAREAEIRWITEGRAGCRLVTPLDDEDLRMAICQSAAIAEFFPGIVAGPVGSRA